MFVVGQDSEHISLFSRNKFPIKNIDITFGGLVIQCQLQHSKYLHGVVPVC